jgi:hypothetical protein
MNCLETDHLLCSQTGRETREAHDWACNCSADLANMDGIGDACTVIMKCVIGDRRRGATILPVTRRNLHCVSLDVRYPPNCTRTCASWHGPCLAQLWMIGTAEARSREERICDERTGQVGRVRRPSGRAFR